MGAVQAHPQYWTPHFSTGSVKQELQLFSFSAGRIDCARTFVFCISNEFANQFNWNIRRTLDLPRELRIYRFRLHEVEAALRESMPENGPIFPQTPLLLVCPDDTKNRDSLLTFQDHDEAIVISNIALASALITYCKNRQLVLPSKGTNAITAQAKTVELRMSLLHRLDEEDAEDMRLEKRTVDEDSLGIAYKKME